MTDAPAIRATSLAALHNGLRAMRASLRPRRFETLDRAEQTALVADAAENVAGMIREAYAEQTSVLLRRFGSAPNYRLTADDLVFADRWAASCRRRADLEAWHDDAENRAAQRLADETINPEQIALFPDAIKARLSARPRLGEEVTLAHAPPGWPPRIVDRSWTATVEWILAARREAAGVAEVSGGA